MSDWLSRTYVRFYSRASMIEQNGDRVEGCAANANSFDPWFWSPRVAAG